MAGAIGGKNSNEMDVWKDIMELAAIQGCNLSKEGMQYRLKATKRYFHLRPARVFSPWLFEAHTTLPTYMIEVICAVPAISTDLHGLE